jgi:hypothetical protein
MERAAILHIPQVVSPRDPAIAAGLLTFRKGPVYNTFQTFEGFVEQTDVRGIANVLRYTGRIKRHLMLKGRKTNEKLKIRIHSDLLNRILIRKPISL